MADKRPRLSLAGLSPAEAAAALNKYYGANTVVVASKAKGLRVDFISTGCYRLDYGLGGGVAKNRIFQVYGPYSSLKSTIGYKVIAEFQRTHPTGVAILVDYEKSHDSAYCSILGIDEDRLYIINPDSGEQGVDVLNDYCTVDFDLFAVVDSLAAIVPTAEIETTVDQQTMALQARLINKMFRILVSRMKRNLYDPKAPSTTVLCNNQIRASMAMYGSPEVTPGGKGKDFAFSQMLVVRSGPSGKLMTKIKRGGIERNVRYGQKVHFSVPKNKVSSSQFDEGDFEYYVRPTDGYAAFSFDNANALIEYGRYYGTIRVKSIPNPRNKKSTIEVFRYPAADWGYLPLDEFRAKLIEETDYSADLHRENLDAIVAEGQGLLTEEEEDDDSPKKKKKKPVAAKKKFVLTSK